MFYAYVTEIKVVGKTSNIYYYDDDGSEGTKKAY